MGEDIEEEEKSAPRLLLPYSGDEVNVFYDGCFCFSAPFFFLVFGFFPTPIVSKYAYWQNCMAAAAMKKMDLPTKESFVIRGWMIQKKTSSGFFYIFF